MVLRKYWKDRARRPVQPVKVYDINRAGTGMMRKDLENHESFSAFAEMRHFKIVRNVSEVKYICVCIDGLFNGMGVTEAAHFLKGEFSIRRSAPITEADETGKWDRAEEVEARSKTDFAHSWAAIRLREEGPSEKKLSGRILFWTIEYENRFREGRGRQDVNQKHRMRGLKYFEPFHPLEKQSYSLNLIVF